MGRRRIFVNPAGDYVHQGRSIFLVKPYGNGGVGKVFHGDKSSGMILPREFVGKRISIKIKVIDE